MDPGGLWFLLAAVYQPISPAYGSDSRLIFEGSSSYSRPSVIRGYSSVPKWLGLCQGWPVDCGRAGLIYRPPLRNAVRFLTWDEPGFVSKQQHQFILSRTSLAPTTSVPAETWLNESLIALSEKKTAQADTIVRLQPRTVVTARVEMER